MKTNYLQTKNKNGISVNICCGSCCHKYKDDAIRNYLCRQENRESNGGDCENWRMTRRLRGAHLSEGRIKKKEYLMFLLKIRETEKDKGGLNPKTKSVEEIRREYEIKYGSIYMNF